MDTAAFDGLYKAATPEELDQVKQPPAEAPAQPVAPENPLTAPFDALYRAEPKRSAEDIIGRGVFSGRDWADTESQLKKGGYQPTPEAKQHFEMQLAKQKALTPQKGLVEKAVDVVGSPFGYETTAGPETTLQKFKRSYMPYGDAVGANGNTAYSAAQLNVKNGKGTQDDYDKIARYETVQKLDETMLKTPEGKLADSVGQISKIVAEMGLGGAVLGKAGALTGIGQADKLTALGRFGGFAGKQALTLPLAPSMYIPMAQQNNIAQGRAANDWRGYPTALGYGYANLLVLGSLQGNMTGSVVSQAIKKGALGTAELTGVDVAAGLADEALPKSFQVGTKYGTLGQLARGTGFDLGGKANPADLRQGLEHVAVQILTFSALSAMHGRSPNLITDPAARQINALRDAGLSEKAAGEVEQKRTIDPIQSILRDPTITREKAIEQLGDAYHNNPVVKVFVDGLPLEQQAAPPPTPAEPNSAQETMNRLGIKSVSEGPGGETFQPETPLSNKSPIPVESVKQPTQLRSPVEVLGEDAIRKFAKLRGYSSVGKIEDVIERLRRSPTDSNGLDQLVKKRLAESEKPTAPEIAPEASKTVEAPKPPESTPTTPEQAPTPIPFDVQAHHRDALMADHLGVPVDELPDTAKSHDTAPAGERFHIFNYLEPGKSVDTAIAALDTRIPTSKVMQTWHDAENAKGQQKAGTATVVMDTREFDGVVQGRTGIDNLKHPLNALPYDPALKKVIYRGGESEPGYAKLKAALDDINVRRAERELKSVALEATEKGETFQPEPVQPAAPERAIPGGAGGGVIGSLPPQERRSIPREGRFATTSQDVLTPHERAADEAFKRTPYERLPKGVRGRAEPLIDKLVSVGMDRETMQTRLRIAWSVEGRDGKNGVSNLLELWQNRIDSFKPKSEAELKPVEDELRAEEENYAKLTELPRPDTRLVGADPGRELAGVGRAADAFLEQQAAEREIRRGIQLAVEVTNAPRKGRTRKVTPESDQGQERGSAATQDQEAPRPGPEAPAGQAGSSVEPKPVDAAGLESNPNADKELLNRLKDSAPASARDYLESAAWNTPSEKTNLSPADRRQATVERIATEWGNATTAGDTEAASYLRSLMLRFGGTVYGAKVGSLVSFDPARYGGPKGEPLNRSVGAKVRVVREPVVSTSFDGREGLALKGVVEPIDRFAGAKQKVLVEGPKERAQRANETKWVADENSLREQGIVTLAEEVRTQYGGIDPDDFRKNHGEGEYQKAQESSGNSMFSGKDGGKGTGKIEDIMAQMKENGQLGNRDLSPEQFLELAGKHVPVEDASGKGYETAQQRDAHRQAADAIRKQFLADNSNATSAEVEKAVKEGLTKQVKKPYQPEDIPFHTPKEGLPPIGDNYPRKLSDFTDVVHREASAENAELLLPNSTTSADKPFGNVTHFSATENLALGQAEHGGQGVKMTFDAKGLTGKVNTSMPAWKYAYANGEAEFVSADKISAMRSAMRSVEFDPKIAARDPYAKRLIRFADRLVAENGWAKETLPDGKVRYSRQERSADTPAHTPKGETFQPSNGVEPPSKPVKAPTPYELAATIDSVLGVTNYTESQTPYGNPAAVAVLKAGEAQPQAVVTQKMYAGEPTVRLEEAGHVLAARYKLELSPAALPPDVAQGFLEFWGKRGETQSRLSTLEGFSQWLIQRTAGKLDPSTQTPAQKAAAAYAEVFVKKNGLEKPLAQIEPLYRAWDSLPPIEKAAKLLSGTGAQANPQLSPQQKVKAASDSIQDRFQDDIDTNLGPLYRVEKWLEGKLGRKLGFAEKASTVFSQLMGQEKALAGSYLRDGVKTLVDGKWVTVGQSEAKILEGAKPEWLTPLFDGGPSKFDLWVTSRHIEGEAGRREAEQVRAKLDPKVKVRAEVVPESMRADYKAAADELGQDAEFKAWVEPAAERLTRAFKDTLHALEGNGIHALPVGTADLLHAKRPDYVPTERVLSDKSWNASTGSRGERGRSVIKERSGSGEQIVSPLVSYRKRLLLIASVQARQLKFNAVSKIAQQPGMGDYLLAGEAKLSQAGEVAFKRINDKLAELGIEGADVTQMMKDVGISNGEAMFLNEPWSQDATKNTYWGIGEDGRPTNFRVADRALYELVTDQQVESHQLAKIVNGIANFSIGGVRPIKAMSDFVKLGATSANLAFHLRNIPRDAYTFWTNTIDRATIGQLPDALRRAFAFEFGVLKANLRGETFQSADKLFQLFHDARGDQLREMGFDKNAPQGASGVGGPKTQVGKAYYSVAGFLKDALNTLGAGELGPRFLEFKTRLKQLTGLDEAGLVKELDRAEKEAAAGREYVQPFDYAKILDSMDAAAEVTTPFNRQGILTRELNKIQPYFGPAIAGASKAVRNIRDNPKGAAMGMAAIASLRVIHWLANKDEQWYEELSANDRYRNFVVQTPWGLRRIPAPRGLEVPVGGFLLPMLDKAAGKKPDIKGLVSATWDDLAPPKPLTPLGTVGSEIAMNQNWRGTPIVPGRDEHLSQIDKITQYQGPYAVEQLTGGRGQLSLRGAGLVPFTEVQNARRSVDEFYQTYQELETARRSAQNRGERFTEEQRYLQFERAKKQIEDLSRQIRGDRLVGGKVTKGEPPAEERVKELRDKQLQVARNLVANPSLSGK